MSRVLSNLQTGRENMDAILESHIAAALGRDRAPADGCRTGNPVKPQNDRSAWQKDYGPRNREVQAATVDASRLASISSGDSDGDGGVDGKDRLDARRSWFGQALWREMMSTLCPGTRNFFIAAGVVAFIVVV